MRGQYDAMNAQVREYVARIRAMLLPPPPGRATAGDPQEIANAIFAILTSREFCYLGRARTEPYRERTLAAMVADIRAAGPVHFYYDLGAGYHASIDPEHSGLVFNVGFSELCVLAQIASFTSRVVEVCAPGAHFTLVIDNLCGFVTNDIPIEHTAAYCAQLRALIDEAGVADRVSVLVESEQFSLAAYQIDRTRLARDMAQLRPSPEDIENVSRFLGRPCDAEEAVERMARYLQAGELTERQLEGVVHGVRMTQRATGGTLGFRPFPGGDSRTQVGEVGICPKPDGSVRAVLLTSRNVARYRCTRLEYPGLLPSAVRYVTFAEPCDVK